MSIRKSIILLAAGLVSISASEGSIHNAWGTDHGSKSAMYDNAARVCQDGSLKSVASALGCSSTFSSVCTSIKNLGDVKKLNEVASILGTTPKVEDILEVINKAPSGGTQGGQLGDLADEFGVSPEDVLDIISSGGSNSNIFSMHTVPIKVNIVNSIGSSETLAVNVSSELKSIDLTGVVWDKSLSRWVDMKGVKVSSVEFVSAPVQAINSLVVDSIAGFGAGMFPGGITNLTIRDARNLNSFKGIPSNIESLSVSRCSNIHNLSKLPSGLSSLHICSFYGLTNPEEFLNLPAGITDLFVENLPGLNGLSILRGFSSLKNIHLKDCENLSDIFEINNKTADSKEEENGLPESKEFFLFDKFHIDNCGKLLSNLEDRPKGFKDKKDERKSIFEYYDKLGGIGLCVKKFIISNCLSLSNDYLRSNILDFAHSIFVFNCPLFQWDKESHIVDLNLANFNLSNNDLNNILSSLQLQSLTLESLGNDIQDLSSLSSQTDLQSLTLGGLNNLQNFSFLSGLSSLQSLTLSNFTNLTSLSLPTLSSLQSLTLYNLSNLTSLSYLSGLSSLQSLTLSHFTNLTSLSLPTLPNLQSLTLCALINLTNFPSLSGFSSLQSLILEGLTKLTSLSLSTLPNLKSLTLYGFNSLTNFPSLSGFSSLQSLTLSTLTSPSLTSIYLPTLPNLQSLILQNGVNVKNLSLSTLPGLQNFQLSYFPVLTNLPSLSGFSSLQSLTLGSFSTQTYLPSLSGLSSLRSLTLQSVSNLQDISLLSGLSSLQSLTLYNLSKVQDFSSLSGLSSLQSLSLDSLSLSDFSFLSGLSSLQSLTLDNLSNLQDISSLSGLSSLQSLTLNNLSNLQDISSLSGLSSLQSLTLNNLSNLQDISSLSGLSSLQSLTLQSLTNLANLSLSGLSSLQSLISNNLNKIQDLSSLSGLPSLQSLSLTYSSSAGNISTLPYLKGLRSLILNRVSDTTDVLRRQFGLLKFLNEDTKEVAIEGYEAFRSLPYSMDAEVLKVYNNQVVESLVIPASIKVLELVDCFKLHSIQFNSNDTLQAIVISNLPLLTSSSLLGSLPNSIKELYLDNLSISDLGSLGSFSQLKSLYIGNTLESNQISSVISAAPSVETLAISLTGDASNVSLSGMSSLNTLVLDLVGVGSKGPGSFPGSLRVFGFSSHSNMGYGFSGGKFDNESLFANLTKVTVPYSKIFLDVADYFRGKGASVEVTDKTFYQYFTESLAKYTDYEFEHTIL